MRHAFLLVSVPIAVAAVVAVACGGSPSTEEEPTEEEDAGGLVIPPTDPPPESPPSGPAGTGLATGLPCDVQAILENRCIACHGGTIAPIMLDYADLVAPAPSDPNKTVAQASVEKMKANAMPPPPAEPPEDDEIAAFEEWVSAGTPKNPEACTDPPPADPSPMDGGTVPDAGIVCTSGTMWTQGDQRSPLMHPGAACNACHQVKGGPNLRIAGTVYPTLHEPDDCNGKGPPPRLTVTIIDARNREVPIEVNQVGNFYTRTRVVPPFRARVSDGTNTREMKGSVTSGDCNSCHSTSGTNGAPGRILAP